MAKVARKSKSNIYFVLIVLTNGYIKQIDDTANVVVQVSSFSVIIHN